MTPHEPFESLTDMRGAAARLAGVILRTPLLDTYNVNAQPGGRPLQTADTLQCPGAVKFRGACHRMARMTGAKRARRAISHSSGNHALGLAQAARAKASPPTSPTATPTMTESTP